MPSEGCSSWQSWCQTLIPDPIWNPSPVPSPAPRPHCQLWSRGSLLLHCLHPGVRAPPLQTSSVLQERLCPWEGSGRTRSPRPRFFPGPGPSLWGSPLAKKCLGQGEDWNRALHPAPHAALGVRGLAHQPQRQEMPPLTAPLLCSPAQRGGLVAGPLAQHRADRLHPQQLRGTL